MKYLLVVALMLLSSFAIAEEKKHNGVCIVRIEPHGGGSGFFVGDNKVVTAYHVIAPCVEENKRIRIEFKNTIALAKVIKHNKETDVALLEAIVDGETILDIAENPPEVGDKVINKGHPHNLWTCHMCEGEVKDIATFTREGKYTSNQYVTKSHVIEGMSGGPVLNEAGQVVGLISARSNDFKQAFCPTLEQIKDILK